MMEKELPKGWEIKSVEQIAKKVQYGFTAQSNHENGNVKYLRITDIQDNKVLWDLVPTCNIQEVEKDNFLLKINDIVFARTGATVGKSFLINELSLDSVFASYLIRLTVKDHIKAQFLKYFFESKDYWNQISDKASGTGQPNVNATKLKEIIFPLPPLPEQERIVAKLDTIFAHLEVAKQGLEKIPVLLKQFRQAVLTQAYSNRYPKVLLKDCTIKIQDGAHHSPKNQYSTFEKGLYPYITSKNIRNNYLDLSKIVYVEKDYHDSIYSRCKPDLGDILLTKDGANTGNVTLNTFDQEFSLLSSVCLIKTNKEKLVPAYLKYYIQSPLGLQELIGEMTGTAIKRIVLHKIKNTLIPLPVKEEQTEIVRRVEALFSKADAIEARYKKLKAQIDQLPQAALAKAFRGEV